MESGPELTIPQDSAAVKRPVLALRYNPRSGCHHVTWYGAPLVICTGDTAVEVDVDIATVWSLNDTPGLRELIAQMLAGPALYAAAKAMIDDISTYHAAYVLMQAAIAAAETLVVEEEVT